MKTRARSTVLLVVGSIAVPFGVGCGGGSSESPAGSTEITAATTPTTVEDAARFRRERDEARQQLAMTQTAFAERHRNDEAIMRSLQDRDATADGALRNLELADKELESLVEKLGRASTAQRAKLEKSIQEVSGRRSHVERELRSLLQAATPAAVEATKPRVDVAIADLVAVIRATPESKTSPEPKPAIRGQ